MDGNKLVVEHQHRRQNRGSVEGASWNRIGPNYFDTVGTRVLRGRPIEERDRPALDR
jgi:hypothetical protein